MGTWRGIAAGPCSSGDGKAAGCSIAAGDTVSTKTREVDCIELGSLKYFYMIQKKDSWQHKLAASHDYSNTILYAIQVWIGSYKPGVSRLCDFPTPELGVAAGME